MRTRILTRAARARASGSNICSRAQKLGSPRWIPAAARGSRRGNGFVYVAFIRTARATPRAKMKVDVFSGSRIILAKQQPDACFSALVSVECGSEC